MCRFVYVFFFCHLCVGFFWGWLCVRACVFVYLGPLTATILSPPPSPTATNTHPTQPPTPPKKQTLGNEFLDPEAWIQIKRAYIVKGADAGAQQQQLDAPAAPAAAAQAAPAAPAQQQ